MKTCESRFLKILLEKKLSHDEYGHLHAFDATPKFQNYVTRSIFVRFNREKASYILQIDIYNYRFCGFEKDE